MKGHYKLIFLCRKFGVDFNHSAACTHSIVDVGFGNGNLLLVLLLVLTKLGALEVGLDEPNFLYQITNQMCSYFGVLHPDLEPLPSLGKQVGAKSSLAGVQGQFLLNVSWKHLSGPVSCFMIKPDPATS